MTSSHIRLLRSAEDADPAVLLAARCLGLLDWRRVTVTAVSKDLVVLSLGTRSSVAIAQLASEIDDLLEAGVLHGWQREKQ